MLLVINMDVGRDRMSYSHAPSTKTTAIMHIQINSIVCRLFIFW